MKTYTFLILWLTFSIGNNIITADSLLQRDNENFDWLLGEWTRTNGKKDLITTEAWEKTANNSYSGTGKTKKNNETVFIENLRLIKKKDHWVYEVTGVNEDTTNFILTSFSGKSFSAENPENPFPKTIAYRLEDQKLIAETSDDSRTIIFEFKRSAQK